ncbi:hypothetical protein GLAREA_05166 [Glarea lozoyensis ATCC 20868]|uniref:Mitochondrial zinc maintenance protein 1, mitochondrial n=1 Tax=Glarea lozoyensis (strain ATCC 20868 / MF5171) TaxID=1116229 RepID=S3EC14_GLAL2|nr:uncharacterized protein GLAREA_05166 [Glarea lozoyensis ATCC 20868]EPE35828.1 hypothetical protein GLAREA_05166 [Glarea lozoyensis ATCC 20868]
MSLATYRQILRSARIAFQGDAPVLQAAKKEARSAFQRYKDLSPNDPAVIAAVEHGEQVAKILLENIVQGKNIGEDRYKLRIHEHTERGDNDTIKMPNGQKVVIDGKKCSD